MLFTPICFCRVCSAVLSLSGYGERFFLFVFAYYRIKGGFWGEEWSVRGLVIKGAEHPSSPFLLSSYSIWLGWARVCSSSWIGHKRDRNFLPPLFPYILYGLGHFVKQCPLRFLSYKKRPSGLTKTDAGWEGSSVRSVGLCLWVLCGACVSSHHQRHQHSTQHSKTLHGGSVEQFR